MAILGFLLNFYISMNRYIDEEGRSHLRKHPIKKLISQIEEQLLNVLFWD